MDEIPGGNKALLVLWDIKKKGKKRKRDGGNMKKNGGRLNFVVSEKWGNYKRRAKVNGLKQVVKD